MFETHKLTEQGYDEVREFKTTLRVAFDTINKLIPEGREKAVFKTHLETACFYGTKAISSKEGNFSEIYTF